MAINDHCVCFVRRVQNPDSESTELLYQPGIICMYDPQTLRAWTFEVIEEDPALCVGSDLTYIPLSGSSHFLTTTLRTMHLEKKRKKNPLYTFFSKATSLSHSENSCTISRGRCCRKSSGENKNCLTL